MNLISIQDLREGMISNQTICDSRGMLLIAKGVTLTKSYIHGLAKFNIKQVDIQSEDEAAKTAAAICSIFSPSGQKAIQTAKGLFDDFKKEKTLDIETDMFRIEQIFYSILEKPAIQQILEEESPHETLYRHSLRTTLIALNMGLKKGYNFLNLEFLAMCALLHDCGMGTDFVEENHHHTFDGFVKLRDNMKLDIIIALVCLQHHERFDGTGIPLSLERNQIVEFARMISVADCYDRLLIRDNTPRQAAFKILSASGTILDPDMVRVFEATIK